MLQVDCFQWVKRSIKHEYLAAVGGLDGGIDALAILNQSGDAFIDRRVESAVAEVDEPTVTVSVVQA
ncbi:hypothetical protein EYC98_17270 [Halieaceae bacterium IMCC14734]|uniref:Uncharacterized protein n=1 Tax=Candidatus Litorirhabdus singularis TaxID=2518993 RepID=A0ABT3TJZ6_9GAMM|nr:hypothetical protein [Candidatus Litorirhabdus singularis]MCX2982614.1 hypothetical protein [Candidatus Litorirhabdus singularis]